MDCLVHICGHVEMHDHCSILNVFAILQIVDTRQVLCTVNTILDLHQLLFFGTACLSHTAILRKFLCSIVARFDDRLICGFKLLNTFQNLLFG